MSFGPKVFSLLVNLPWRLSWLVHGGQGLRFHHQLLYMQKWYRGTAINTYGWEYRVFKDLLYVAFLGYWKERFFCVGFTYFTLGLHINTSWCWLITLGYYQPHQTCYQYTGEEGVVLEKQTWARALELSVVSVFLLSLGPVVWVSSSSL